LSEHKHYFDNALTHELLCIVNNHATLRERAKLYFTPYVFVKLIVETELMEWSEVKRRGGIIVHCNMPASYTTKIPRRRSHVFFP
jgi:hypothetical protein